MSNDSDLLTRIENHVTLMAAHIKKRRGVQLLIEAAEEIKRLRGIIAKDEEELRKATADMTATLPEPVSSCHGVPMRLVGVNLECTYCGLVCNPVIP